VRVGQLVQVIGSLLVLSAFSAAQVGRLAQKSVGYLSLNLVGSGVLAVEAVLVRQWGFLLLEGVWAVVSALSPTARRNPSGTSFESRSFRSDHFKFSACWHSFALAGAGSAAATRSA